MRLAELAPRANFGTVCVLTGAGISAAAGLPTFRGPNGLWTLDPELERALDGSQVPDNIPLMWRAWGTIYAAAVAAGPTPAHRALAAAGTTVVTQNIDTLHSLAGSEPIELHGSAGVACCSRRPTHWRSDVSVRPEAGVAAPGGVYVAGAVEGEDGLPACPLCDAPVRQDVVLFGEALPAAALSAAVAAAGGCDLFLAVGTSGTVAPASELAALARSAGAYCVNVVLHPDGSPNPAFHDQVVGDAQVEVPAWANGPDSVVIM